MTARGQGQGVVRSVLTRALVAGLVVNAGLAFGLGSTQAGAAQYSADQWGLNVIGAPTAWQYGTGSGVTIGIVDTGVDTSQEDLTGKVVAGTTILSDPSSGCNTEQTDPNGEDDNGHGTHVAGIAAASGRVGVSGVAPGASLVVAKVLDCDGSGEISDVESGISWVVAHGARVINLSLAESSIAGLIDPTQLEGNPLASALQAAWNAGAIPVVAGGNNSDGLAGLGDEDYSGIPAVVVAATGSPTNGEEDQVASYSNNVNEAEWGVAAPGGDDPNGPSTPTCGQYDGYEILSTYWTSANATSCYATDEGTSMATPFVTGTLALLLGRGLTQTQAVQTLLSTADHNVSCGSDCSGLIDAAAAMQSVAGASRAAGAASTTTTRPDAPHSAAATSEGSPGTTAATTTSTSSSTTTTAAKASSKAHASALGAGRRTAGSANGSAWWLLLPILVGLGAAGTLAVVVRRRWGLRHAPAAAGHGAPPPGPGPGPPAPPT